MANILRLIKYIRYRRNIYIFFFYLSSRHLGIAQSYLPLYKDPLLVGLLRWRVIIVPQQNVLGLTLLLSYALFLLNHCASKWYCFSLFLVSYRGGGVMCVFMCVFMMCVFINY